MRKAGKAGGNAPDAMMLLNADLAVTAVEVSHPAGAHMSGTDGKPGPASVEDGEIDELEKRPFEGSRRVVARAIGAQRHVGSQESQRIGLEEAGNAIAQGLPTRKRPVRTKSA